MPSFADLYLGRPDFRALHERASEQDGLFTVEEARACGFSRALLSHHAKTGRFGHPRRGIYRWPGPDDVPLVWAGIPTGRFEPVRLEWMTAGRRHAVVSHSTALRLLGLVDGDSREVHLTLHRGRRGTIPSREVQRARGLRIHLVPVPLRPADRVERHGIVVTAAERAIVDAAKDWESPHVVAAAVERARAAGTIEPDRLIARARRRGRRVRSVVEAALAETGASTSRRAPWP